MCARMWRAWGLQHALAHVLAPVGFHEARSAPAPPAAAPGPRGDALHTVTLAQSISVSQIHAAAATAWRGGPNRGRMCATVITPAGTLPQPCRRAIGPAKPPAWTDSALAMLQRSCARRRGGGGPDRMTGSQELRVALGRSWPRVCCSMPPIWAPPYAPAPRPLPH